MHFQYEVAPPTPAAPPTPPPNPAEATNELLRQLLEVQREHLGAVRAAQAAQDGNARWRNFLGRWQGEFPDMGETCKHVLPHLERGYLRLIDDLSRHLQSDEGGGIDDEFTLNEFLDRYGMRLAQLGAILSLVGTLAEAGGGKPEG